jgi:putative membrane protein
MIQFLSKTLITSVAVLIAYFLLKDYGVYIDGTTTAVLVAVVLGLLNSFVKPILIVLTIPISIVTLGLFLLVINIIIIKLASEIVPGFKVHGWLAALLFSFIVSFVSSIIQNLIKNNKEKN